jgi:hypothetical protein
MRLTVLNYVFTALSLSFPVLAATPIADTPFWQDTAVRIHHAPELTNAVFKKLCMDKENTVYVLTDKGVARLYNDTLALDKSYRPLAGKIAGDIALTPDGDLAYRFEEGWLSNGGNGGLDLNTGPAWFNPPPALKSQPGMPWPELTCRAGVAGGAWFGTTRGAFFERDGTNSR